MTFIKTRRGILLAIQISMLLISSSCTKIIKEQEFFYPRRVSVISDKAARRNVCLITKDSTALRGWYLSSPEYHRMMLYFYGNGMSVLRSMSQLHWLSDSLRCNILAFDYRGYCFSDGVPTLRSLLQDALEQYDYARDTLNAAGMPIFVFGHSIGTIFATKLAAERRVDGLILVSPMTSATETISAMEKTLPFYIRWFIRLKPDPSLLDPALQPVEMVRNVRCPMLVIHGTDDRMIPMKMGKKIFYEAGTKQKHWCEVRGKGHNDLNISTGPAADSLRAFFDQAGNGR